LAVVDGTDFKGFWGVRRRATHKPRGILLKRLRMRRGRSGMANAGMIPQAGGMLRERRTT
jgi:hypothetical protein